MQTQLTEIQKQIVQAIKDSQFVEENLKIAGHKTTVPGIINYLKEKDQRSPEEIRRELTAMEGVEIVNSIEGIFSVPGKYF
jgi:hypothetical protein